MLNDDAQKKKIELTRLQGIIAVASFNSGVLIAAVCLFFIPPLGEIASSAVSIVSELLVLCGAILGVKASYDVKFRKFEAELNQVIENNLNQPMKPSALLAIALCLSACGTVRPFLESASTRVEVKTMVETIHDTAYVQLQVNVERVATLDTASVLENKYAKSAALISGVLTHSLETKPAKEPVSVEKQIVYRDSLIYRDRVVTETVEMEKKLSAWQSFKMKAGGFLIVILLIVVLYTIFTNFLKLKRL